MALEVMILGANSFIGSALISSILRHRPWEVYGIDLADDKLREHESDPRFHFVERDITIDREWVEYHVKKCDVVVPLVAIANPAQYVLDRFICACGVRDGLNYTLFRPVNFIGPKSRQH